ncbi:MAG: sensor histidine kinase [Planctomycetes bacterium]|nr:sensor histidine kinase [Planctomycetota bacterium]
MAFAGVTLTFLLATGISQVWALSIEPRSTNIATNSAPSIRHLTGAAAELRHVQALLAALVLQADERPPHELLGELEAARRRLDEDVHAYQALPALQEERALWPPVERDLIQLEGAIDAVVACVERRDAAAAEAALTGAFEVLADRTSDDLERTIDLNARAVQADAHEIARMRDRAFSLLLALDGVAVLLTVAAAVAVVRGVSQHDRLQEANASLLRRRVDELEAFAGRVAHDVLGPLGGVSLALDALARQCGDDPAPARILARARGCLHGVDRVVIDLLAFARAGARPAPGGRSEVAPAVAAVLADAEADAAAGGIALRAEVGPVRPIACAEGVLLSLLSNLVRNAIKHMGATPTRREVVVRAAERDHDRVRLEVQDTGPGLEPDLVAVAFEPHVRGPQAATAGLGLGLATVRRLAEAHGGRVGVVTAPGRGSTFWVELPAAATPAPVAAV